VGFGLHIHEDGCNKFAAKRPASSRAIGLKTEYDSASATRRNSRPARSSGCRQFRTDSRSRWQKYGGSNLLASGARRNKRANGKIQFRCK
jgi:hypothetical protein